MADNEHFREQEESRRNFEEDKNRDMELEEDSGFRFKRRVKKKTPNSEEQTEHGENVEKCATSKISTKRRRSSFIPGRKVVSPLEYCHSTSITDFQGLYKEIPSNLKEEERLLQLFDKSLDLMCINIKSKGASNISDFEERVEEYVKNLRAKLSEKINLAKIAAELNNTSNERVTAPNAKAIRLEEYAKKSEETMKRMTVESQAWEDLLESYRHEEKETLIDVKNSYNKITKECLSKEKQEFLNSLHLRDGFLDDLRKAKDEAILLTEKIVKNVSTVKHFKDVLTNYLEKYSNDFMALPSQLNDGDTPRRLILGVTKDSTQPT
ncbi:uncharacterized protein LOC124438419 [Xenia sp. Carnegie-2017]|uniref:uncharacterized protein LOC124438419 n=1 Tax=Xenia sp. Carnegie-2017 TaxID=2897299 RepID=UPI001F046261|nr:uncharacterized protein LOC124438419 [Xenia sp. Carnegie-2017]